MTAEGRRNRPPSRLRRPLSVRRSQRTWYGMLLLMTMIHVDDVDLGRLSTSPRLWDRRRHMLGDKYTDTYHVHQLLFISPLLRQNGSTAIHRYIFKKHETLMPETYILKTVNFGQQQVRAPAWTTIRRDITTPPCFNMCSHSFWWFLRLITLLVAGWGQDRHLTSFSA